MMSRHLRLAYFLVSLLLAAPGYAADPTAQKYLCVADKATGFHFNAKTKSWEPTHFTTDKKWLLGPMDPSVAKSLWTHSSPPPRVGLTEVGQSVPGLFCSDFNEFGLLGCSGFITLEVFELNRSNGRYVRSSFSGYVELGLPLGFPAGTKITDATSDDTLIEIGKCSPI